MSQLQGRVLLGKCNVVGSRDSSEPQAKQLRMTHVIVSCWGVMLYFRTFDRDHRLPIQNLNVQKGLGYKASQHEDVKQVKK